MKTQPPNVVPIPAKVQARDETGTLPIPGPVDVHGSLLESCRAVRRTGAKIRRRGVTLTVSAKAASESRLLHPTTASKSFASTLSPTRTSNCFTFPSCGA